MTLVSNLTAFSSPTAGQTGQDQAKQSPSQQSFAALMRQRPKSPDGQRTGPARFDETGLLDARPIPLPDAAARRADTALKSSQDKTASGASGADGKAILTPVARRESAARLGPQLEVSGRPAPEAKAKTVSARAEAAGAAPQLRRTPNRAGALRARPVMQKTHARLQTSTVFVALRPTHTSVCVFARPGRMAPTEQMKLRNAVSALLAEFGYHHAAIKFGATAGETSWRK